VSDLVSRLLEAIEKVEHTTELAGPAVIGWAAYQHENGSIKYCSPVARNGDVWVTGGAETEPSSVMVVFDPSSVLRRCEADRELVEAYAKVAEYDNWEDSYEHATGRACGLGEAVRLLARGYGITEEET
jgi:hypothetical protein